MLLYYWNDEKTPAKCGWWIGHKVGNDSWARNPSTGIRPAESGWIARWHRDERLVPRLKVTSAITCAACAGLIPVSLEPLERRPDPEPPVARRRRTSEASASSIVVSDAEEETPVPAASSGSLRDAVLEELDRRIEEDTPSSMSAAEVRRQWRTSTAFAAQRDPVAASSRASAQRAAEARPRPQTPPGIASHRPLLGAEAAVAYFKARPQPRPQPQTPAGISRSQPRPQPQTPAGLFPPQPFTPAGILEPQPRTPDDGGLPCFIPAEPPVGRAPPAPMGPPPPPTPVEALMAPPAPWTPWFGAPVGALEPQPRPPVGVLDAPLTQFLRPPPPPPSPPRQAEGTVPPIMTPVPPPWDEGYQRWETW